MKSTTVIARAYGWEPLIRLAEVQENGLVYVRNPDSNHRDSFVGFPPKDVFAMDEHIFELLRREWQSEGKTNQQTWAKLNRYAHTT